MCYLMQININFSDPLMWVSSVKKEHKILSCYIYIHALNIVVKRGVNNRHFRRNIAVNLLSD